MAVLFYVLLFLLQLHNPQGPFQILLDDNKGWFHLLDENDEITSKAIIDIFNYFGVEKWELVSIDNIKPQILTHYVLAPGYLEERYHCIFKREKKGG